VRLASENPAEYLQDDTRVANRVSEAMAGAAANRDILVFLDTFTDLDRGYFPRIGLYDRRYNRRAGSFVFANMQEVLHSYGPDFKLGSCHESKNGKTCVFEGRQETFNLFLPSLRGEHGCRLAFPGETQVGEKGEAKIVDLLSGSVSEVDWVRDGEGLAFLDPCPSRMPSLFILEKNR
jgi:hypothetical protein